MPELEGVALMGVRICEFCGAYLDPGEICDCEKEGNEEGGSEDG